MKERPILMCADMVRAIIAGRKTQTRRPITDVGVQVAAMHGGAMATGLALTLCPFGQPGDRLWVRETWGLARMECPSNCTNPEHVYYKADWEEEGSGPVEKWRPSIHMPRWASRLILEVVSVRIERLQDITYEDARAEGAEQCNEGLDHSFCLLWDSIYTKLGQRWRHNPWVWAVEFKRIGDAT
jgi:hypothetical protein